MDVSYLSEPLHQHRLLCRMRCRRTRIDSANVPPTSKLSIPMILYPSLVSFNKNLSWEDPPNVLESFSQRHDTRVAGVGNLSLANLFAFL